MEEETPYLALSALRAIDEVLRRDEGIVLYGAALTDRQKGQLMKLRKEWVVQLIRDIGLPPDATSHPDVTHL